jgi:hypothetical protein
MSDKPSAAWYLAPIFLGIVGAAIMWFVLKDEDHPDSKKMIKKGWIIGIALTVISFAWIPFVLIPIALTGGFDEQHMQEKMPVPVERMVPPVPAVSAPTDASSITNFEECIAAGNPAMESYPRQCNTSDGKHFVENIPGQEQCQLSGGLWGIWSNAFDSSESCNASTSDQGKKCTDSTQCQSFCQAKEGSEINSESAGMCYGYELATCMQVVQNGVVQNEWCQ